MPFEQHQEKNYPKDAQSIFQAALTVTEKFGGKIISSAPEKFKLTARFPKVILGQTLGDRTELSCEVRVDGEGKLMFGACKGVMQTVVTWFIAHLEHNLGIPPVK